MQCRCNGALTMNPYVSLEKVIFHFKHPEDLFPLPLSPGFGLRSRSPGFGHAPGKMPVLVRKRARVDFTLAELTETALINVSLISRRYEKDGALWLANRFLFLRPLDSEESLYWEEWRTAREEYFELLATQCSWDAEAIVDDQRGMLRIICRDPISIPAVRKAA